MPTEFSIPGTDGDLRFPVSRGSTTTFCGANGSGKTRLAVHIEQLADLCHDPRAARPAAVAAVVFPRDEATMPGEQGIGGDQRLKLTERAATESLGLCRQAPPLPVRDGAGVPGCVPAAHDFLPGDSR